MRYKDIREIALLEGLPMVDETLINKLIDNGWSIELFKQIEDEKGFRCPHGNIVAFYSKRRNSILIPNVVGDDQVTWEISQKEISLHVISTFEISQSDLFSRKSRMC